MPIILGKKCPRCRSGNSSPLPEQSWFLRLPGVAHLICRDCGQNFYFFNVASVSYDRRSRERIHPARTLLVRFGKTKQQFAAIEDINIKGIGFTCTQEQETDFTDYLTIDLFNCKEGTWLEKLPVRIVSSGTPSVKSTGLQTARKRNGCCFIGLNQTQKKLLTHLIKTSGRDKEHNRSTIHSTTRTTHISQ